MKPRYLTSKTINILIVDDNSFFRNIIKKRLNNETRCNIIGEYSNDESCLYKNFIEHADIIFLDLQMPKMTGVLSALQMLNFFPKAKIIAVSMLKYNDYNGLLKEFGFKGCINKQNFLEEILPAIETVHSGGCYFKENFQLHFNNTIIYN